MPRPSRRGREGRRIGNRGRVVLAVLAVVLVGLALSLRAIATFWTDFLWFRSLDFGQVWQRLLSAKLTLGVGAALVFFLLLWVNMLIADRLAPRFRSVGGGEDEILVRYRELVAGRQRLLWLLVAAVIAIVPGVSASAQWREWLLFRHGGSFGVRDPELGTDIGFYVFKLPFLSLAVDWLFGFLVVTTLVVAVVHYLNGAIRLQPMGERVTQNAKAHLSVLLALAALAKAADYWLQRYELMFSPGRSFDGAGFTAVNARMPAVQLLILISVFVAVLLLVNIWRRGWVLPVIVVGVWALVVLVAGTLYPQFVQRFQVSPAELAKERPYIERNIAGTRAALGMDEVEQADFVYDPVLTAEKLERQESNLDNARLLDPEVIRPTIEDLEFGREYYAFRDVDVDRYLVEEAEGAEVRTPVVVSTRELNEEGIPNPTWEKRRLVFTHGYGMALAPSNQVDDRGEPRFLVSGIPAESRGVPPLERPEIYHGEEMGGYAIVGTDQTELSTDQVTTRYEGTSGVPVDSFFRKAAFALRFGEIEPLISGNLTQRSRVIFVRDVKERVATVAPFLELDTDPYPVLVDGRIKYVVDGYTTTGNYPYAERLDSTTGDTGVIGVNYVRNSVKAVVDAYDGTVDLYLSDTLYGERDPIIRAYAKAFPDLFETEIPESLSRHFRYPELLFAVQTAMWGRYHQSDPDSFFNNTDRWDIAQAPPSTSAASTAPTTTAAAATGAGGPVPTTAPTQLTRIVATYQLMQLRPDEDPEFVLTRPFVLASRTDNARNLTALLIARNDPGSYGKLSQIVMSSRDREGEIERNNRVDGPLRANQKMVTYQPSSAYQALVGRAGSQVRFGNLLIIPFGDSLLYLRPVYAKEETSGRFTLQRVMVNSGDAIGFGETVELALADMFDSNPDGVEDAGDGDTGDPEDVGSGGEDDGSTEGPAPTTTTPGTGAGATPEQLLAAADERFDEADAALREGDLGRYQAAVREAQRLVEEAATALSAVVGGPSGTGET